MTRQESVVMTTCVTLGNYGEETNHTPFLGIKFKTFPERYFHFSQKKRALCWQANTLLGKGLILDGPLRGLFLIFRQQMCKLSPIG